MSFKGHINRLLTALPEGNKPFSARRRFALLVSVMVAVSTIGMIILLTVLFRYSIKQWEIQLLANVQNQILLIETIAEYNESLSEYIQNEYPDYDPTIATLKEITTTHVHISQLGRSIEFTLARLKGDSIVFLTTCRASDSTLFAPISLQSANAEPQRRALQGESGSLTGLDYRGEKVLAAYSFIDDLKLGVVVKVDISEIRAPLIGAALTGIISIGIIIIMGSLVFIRVGNPVIRRLENHTKELEKEIDQRKKVEMVLSESEAKYKALFEGVPDAIFVYDPDTFEILSSNKATSKIYGYDNDELIGMSCLKFSAEVEKSKTEVNKIRERGQTFVKYRHHKKKDGTDLFVNVSGYKIMVNEREFMFAVSRDFTKRKASEDALIQAHKELAQTNEMLERTNELARVGGWEYDFSRESLYWTSETYRIYEIDQTLEPSLETALNHYEGESEQQVSKAVNAAIEHGIPFDLEVPFKTANGRSKWVRSQGFPVHENGQIVKLHGAFQDITNRKESEQIRLELETQLHQSQKLETVGTMVSGIAHEFNNVLQSMFLHGELVKIKLPEENELKNNFQHMIDDGHRARDLINQILTFSKKAQVVLKPQYLQEWIEESITLERALLPPNIAINSEIDSNCGMVLCDKTQITQILLNLSNNAKHAMEEDGGTLSIALKQTMAELSPGESKIDVLELTVMDTGHGIDPTDLGNIFDPFFTTKELGRGTGLGLSVVHGIVTGMGGQINVSSKVGDGTTFQILLPVINKKPHQRGETTAKSTSPSAKGSVLIVDDEESIRRAMQHRLTHKGFTVDCASNGKSALKLFSTAPQKYDLIVTDQSMPEMSGLELAREVRELKSDVPIIISSGQLEAPADSDIKDLGISGFIQKPWTANELIERIVELDGQSG